MSFDAIAKDLHDEVHAGRPIAIAFSQTERMPVWAQIAGVFKDAPHPNAARLYLAWFMQPEQQRRLGHWSSRSDIPPPEGLKPLSSYDLANSYRSFVMDEVRAKTLRELYLGFTGPVTSSGTYR